jgi:hypothetical protein
MDNMQKDIYIQETMNIMKDLVTLTHKKAEAKARLRLRS